MLGSLAAGIDVAIVRVLHEPVTASLQFPVELIEHQVAEQEQG